MSFGWHLRLQHWRARVCAIRRSFRETHQGFDAGEGLVARSNETRRHQRHAPQSAFGPAVLVSHRPHQFEHL